MALTSTEEAQIRALISQQAALLSLAGNETTITSKLSATKVNLSGIAAASALADTDLTLVRQGAADKSSSLTVLKTWITSSMASIATASGFAALFGPASGYIKLPSWLGGVIIQWSSVSMPGTQGGATNFTYPIAFPNSIRAAAFAGDFTAASPGHVTMSIVSRSLSAAQLLNIGMSATIGASSPTTVIMIGN